MLAEAIPKENEPKATPQEDCPESAPPPPARSHGYGGGLTKVTVNLVPRASVALDEASAITGDTKTETINRALQLYAWMQKMIDEGNQLVVINADGNKQEIKLF